VVEAGGGEEAAPTLASILASTGNIDASTGATLSAPTTPLANAGASPPPFPDHLDVCSKQIPESVDVAITDRAEKRAASSSVLGCPPRNLGHPSSM